MSVPPKFSDIGKSVNDLLNKDFPVGVAKLEVKTTAANGVCFTVSGNQNNKTGIIAGDLKTKFVEKSRGLTVTESWSSSNVVGLEVELADSLVKGLKLSLKGNLVPSATSKSASAGVEFKKEHLFSTANLDVFNGPSVSADAVVGAEGFLLGGQVAYNIKDGKVSKFGATMGYLGKDYTVSLNGSNGFSVFSAGYFHQVSGKLEAGAIASYDTKKSGNVGIEVGSKYSLDRATSVKTKVNNTGVLGLSLTQTVRPGVKVTLGGLFDTARFQENAHKMGVSLSLEA